MGNSMILVIGGLILMGMFMLSANGLMFQNTQTAEQNEVFLTAISVGQSVIDEAMTKAFDQATVSTPVTSAASLTSISSLGSDYGGEIVPVPDTLSGGQFFSTARFTDVDDYQGYSRRVLTRNTYPLTVSVAVQYVSETTPDLVVGAPTFCKRMTVTVSGDQLDAPVVLQYVFTY
jgi:hypothetical protein